MRQRLCTGACLARVGDSELHELLAKGAEPFPQICFVGRGHDSRGARQAMDGARPHHAFVLIALQHGEDN